MRRYPLLAILVLLVFLLCTRCRSGVRVEDTGTGTDSSRVVLSGLNIPWEILWGKDDHIWMTERNGKISRINPVNGTVVFSSTIPEVVNNNEGGLLGMVQHPGFLTNGLFYVVYNYNVSGNYREKLVQMKFENNSVSPVKTIIENIPAAGIHNGSRLLISNDAAPCLFMTTGDASVQPNAQSLSSLSGKVLRFNLDGTIPADNPIAGNPVWSFGHRNQQGLVMANGILYASEHGPSIEDEVNIIEKNRNYGWPSVNGPCDQAAEINFCNANNVQEPIWSSGSSTIAVCGLDYYNNSLIPGLQNSLLMCTLKDESLRVLTLNSNGSGVIRQQTLYKGKYGRLRDICISPAGKVYLCTSNGGNDDKIIEITKIP
jgi:aldose sugar dehydrogenase